MAISVNRPLELQVQQKGRAVMVMARGFAGATDAPKLQAELQRLAKTPGALIVLNLTNLEFLGPDGLDAMLSAHLLVKAQHGQIRLVSPNAEIRRMLQVTRLTEVFPIYDSVSQAVEAE
jgi:anti-anti-sigma factor